MASVDVTIRGAGIFGLSIAWACVARGARVRVIDPYGPGAGASGGIVGALAPHVPENWNAKKAFQLDSLLMAQRFWDEVEAVGGRSAGYARLGRLQPVIDEAGLALAHRRAETAKTLWTDRAVWEVLPVSVAGPFVPHSPTGWVIRDTLSARVHPRRACDALVAALISKGCEIVHEGVESGAVVWAHGWQGLRDLTDRLERKIGDGVKGQAVLLAYSAPTAPQLFVDGLHLVPHADGTLAVGSTSEREFEAADCVDAQCDMLLDRARMALPALRDAPEVMRWAGVRPRAQSRAPVLGAWPDRTGHYVANGGFKIGFGMAPKIAQVMTDFVLEGDDNIPADFRLSGLL